MSEYELFQRKAFLVYTHGDRRFDDGHCRLASSDLPITQVSLLLLSLLGNYVTHPRLVHPIDPSSFVC